MTPHTAHVCTHTPHTHTSPFTHAHAHTHTPPTAAHAHTHIHCTCAHTLHTHTSPARTHTYTLPPSHTRTHTHTPPTPASAALALLMKPRRCCLWFLIRSVDSPAQQPGVPLSTCGVSFLSEGPRLTGPTPPPWAVLSGGPGRAASPAPCCVRMQPRGASPEPARHPQGCHGRFRPGQTGSPSRQAGV